MANYLIIRSEDDERIFTREVAARLADVSLDFLAQCEAQGLIASRPMAGGGAGFSVADVRNLARMGRLRRDLELDLSAVEVVLHMRQRMVEMLREMEQIEQEMVQRELEMQRRLRRLRRRAATEAEWE